MVTIRQLAGCTGLFAPVISVRSLFGARQPPLSLLNLISSAMQRKVDLNVIFVGTELHALKISSAINTTAEIFATVDLGIGKIQQFSIPLDEADGHEDIDSEDEADALMEAFGFPGAAVDAFFVLTFAGLTVGLSPVFGSCKHGDEPDSGLVVSVEESEQTTGNALAHELVHYLGLGAHHPSALNLMFEKVPNGMQLTAEQGKLIKGHCLVYTGCRL